MDEAPDQLAGRGVLDRVRVNAVIVASGRDTLVNAPWVATAPGVMLVVVVVGCTLLGDAVRDVIGRRSSVIG